MKYRKKPVVIDAVWFDGTDERAMIVKREFPDINLQFDTDKYCWFVETLEGNQYLLTNDGMWIIRGVAGEYYPCKPDIFDQTYEEVE